MHILTEKSIRIMQCLVFAVVWVLMNTLSSDLLESEETNVPEALTSIGL